MQTSSYEPLVFKDREEAGALLAEKFSGSHTFINSKHTVVFALTNNSMPVGYKVAEYLNVPLDTIVTRKLTFSKNPEIIFGALSAGDVVTIDRSLQQILDISDEALHDQIVGELQALKEAIIKFQSGLNIPATKVSTAIITDDGTASVFEIRAAIESIRVFYNPHAIIFASPVCSVETRAFIKNEVRDVVSISHPRHLYAISNWYEDFNAVTDNQAVFYLNQAAQFNSMSNQNKLLKNKNSKTLKEGSKIYKFKTAFS